jgi:hypothetical protein
LPDGWTSLDAAKLGIELAKGIAFPVALAYVGVEVSRVKQADEGLVKRRLQSLDVIAPAANNILCFATVTGDWRSLDPEKVIDFKRVVDREMWTYLGIWSSDVWSSYQSFVQSVFKEYGGGASKPAKIYGDVRSLREEMGEHFQDTNWTDSFEAPPSGWSHNLIREKYQIWMRAMRKDISSAAQ